MDNIIVDTLSLIFLNNIRGSVQYIRANESAIREFPEMQIPGSRIEREEISLL